MICDGCEKEAGRVIKCGPGYLCKHCLRSDAPVGGGVIVRGVNRYNRKMSYATQMALKTRRLRSDGKIRPDARWAANNGW